MDEQLEVEPRRQSTRVAVAARRLVDAPKAPPEREVAGLDGVEEERPVGSVVLDEEERRVTLELREPERRLEPPDDRLDEVAGDGRGVLDLASGEVGRVAGQVRNEEEAGLWCRSHGTTLDLGAAPMSMPFWRASSYRPRCRRNASSTSSMIGFGTTPRRLSSRSTATDRTCSACAFES